MRTTVLAGAVMLALGFFLLAGLAVSPLSYIILMTLVGALGAGASPVAYTRAVTIAFVRGRGTALGICRTIVGVASVLLPGIAGESIARLGWRGIIAANVYCWRAAGPARPRWPPWPSGSGDMRSVRTLLEKLETPSRTPRAR